MNKKAILIASVGTSKTEALEKTTYCFQKEVKEAFPEFPCYVGFSSQSILQKMKAAGIQCYGVTEALEEMLADGIEEVIIQPTNLLGGQETNSLTEQIDGYRNRFTRISIGKPLLTAKEDYIRTLQVIAEYVQPEAEEALVLVGHGSAHVSGNSYQNLEYTAYVQGYRNVFVGTMENKGRNMTVRKLSVSGYRKICLFPLLFVAGYHAVKDIMAESGSWKTILEEEGYEVRSCLCGIGELSGIREIFRIHLEEAMNGEPK